MTQFKKTVNTWSKPNTNLVYNKGENRIKHCGATNVAQASCEDDGAIGICPNTVSMQKANQLLQNGIPEFRKTSLDKPFRIWAYHEGAIYAARTEDGGKKWHAYPTKIGIPQKILIQIKEDNKTELRFIKKWMKK